MAIFVDEQTKVARPGDNRTRRRLPQQASMLAYGTKHRGRRDARQAAARPSRTRSPSTTPSSRGRGKAPAPTPRSFSCRRRSAPPAPSTRQPTPGCKLIVCITEGVPTVDMVKVMPYLEERGVRLLGPNCPGLLAPGIAKLGILPASIVKEGPVGTGFPQRHPDLRGCLPADQPPALGRPPAWASGATRSSAPISWTPSRPSTSRSQDRGASCMIGEIGGDAEEQAAAAYIKEQRQQARGQLHRRPAPRLPASGWAMPGPSSAAAAERLPRK
jgi:hypothetical protein